jgi:hypothetical protein
MFRKLLQKFKGKQTPIILDQRERDSLIRENAEARGESLGQANRDESLGSRFIDQVSAPGVVGDPTVLVTRTAEEQRALNRPPI